MKLQGPYPLFSQKKKKKKEGPYPLFHERVYNSSNPKNCSLTRKLNKAFMSHELQTKTPF